MTVDLTTQIDIQPDGQGQTVSVKAIMRFALFNAAPQTIGRDQAEALYQKITESNGSIDLQSEEVTALKNAVDSVYARGVSWQFANIVDPPSGGE